MTVRSYTIAVAITLLILAPFVRADEFESVSALIATRCLECHSGAEPSGNLDLTRHEGLERGGDSGTSVIPGKPDESILMFRLETEEPGARMPSLARNLIHEESNQLIREWILSMPADHAAPPK